jgi:hypothetical protein
MDIKKAKCENVDWVQLAISCEHANDRLSSYQLLEKGSSPWAQRLLNNTLPSHEVMFNNWIVIPCSQPCR